MKYATVPVVAAPYGMTLGGGLELCFGAGDVQAAAETYSGLVEVGVGLIPGGGGHDEHALARARGHARGRDDRHVRARHAGVQEHRDGARSRPAPTRRRPSGTSARTDGVSLRPGAPAHRGEGAGASASRRAGWHPPAPRAYVLPGESGIATLAMMVDTLVDAAGRRARTTRRSRASSPRCSAAAAGGAAREVTEDEMLELEREAFVSLVRRAQEPGAHAVHAHEQQAAEELAMGAMMRTS